MYTVLLRDCNFAPDGLLLGSGFIVTNTRGSKSMSRVTAIIRFDVPLTSNSVTLPTRSYKGKKIASSLSSRAVHVGLRVGAFRFPW